MEEETMCRKDTIESRVIGKYIRTNRRHRKVLEQELRSTGVHRSQHQLLMFIADHPNLSQKELAGRQGVSAATTAVSLKKLEQGGYVKRVVDLKDNRCNQICITEKGTEVVRSSKAVFEELERVMFTGFSPEDFRIMGELLDRMYDNMEVYVPKDWTSRKQTEREDVK